MKQDQTDAGRGTVVVLGWITLLAGAGLILLELRGAGGIGLGTGLGALGGITLGALMILFPRKVIGG